MPAQRDNDPLTAKIIGFAIEVVDSSGPACWSPRMRNVCYELRQGGIGFRRQVSLPVVYKSIRLDCGYRIDVVIEERVILELKTVERLMPVHDAPISS